MIDFYGYARCDTCRRAQKLLDALGVTYLFIDITEQAPKRAQLAAALKGGRYKLADLCNRSGVQYRELNMKEKLKTLSEAEVLSLLAENGRLCKRPFITDGKCVTVGFDAAVLREAWG